MSRLQNLLIPAAQFQLNVKNGVMPEKSTHDKPEHEYFRTLLKKYQRLFHEQVEQNMVLQMQTPDQDRSLESPSEDDPPPTEE